MWHSPNPYYHGQDGTLKSALASALGMIVGNLLLVAFLYLLTTIGFVGTMIVIVLLLAVWGIWSK